jgi:group II intron reverse transcriptase/maturase
VSTRSQQIAERARQFPDEGLRTLHHYIDQTWLHEAYDRTRKDGAVGIDGVDAATYAEDLTSNLLDLENRMKSGRYVAPHGKRAYVPKGKHGKRPISINCFEDKVAQRAVAMVYEPIFEEEFMDFSYGFRPHRSPHDALNKLFQQIQSMGGCWLLDADVESYFDKVNKQHLRDMVRSRVRDGVLDRLLGKWLHAGVMDDGLVTYPESGVPQGGVISPILSNIYLHYVLDEWFVKHVQPRLSGRAFMIRFADDFVMGFAEERDARRVLEVLPKRFGRYDLRLHPEKTRLLHFVPPERGDATTSFDFLGFTHRWERSRKGRWVVRQSTKKASMCKALAKIWETCRTHRHMSLKEQCQDLNRRLNGHYQYFGITGNHPNVYRFYRRVRRIWRYWLGKRDRSRAMPWRRFQQLLRHYPLAPPWIPHSVYHNS